MVDGTKLWIVARFELIEAIRSRLFVTAMILFAAGASLGSFLFLKGVQTAENTARTALAAQLGVPSSQIPASVVSERAVPFLTSFVHDEAIRQQVLQMPLLSVFYGYMALYFVVPWVLIVCTGTWAHDRASGASRYTLFRCDRLTWALGKLLGQQGVLATGLFVGALFAYGVALYFSQALEPLTLVWLLRTSVRAWIYANAYLGIFAGLSLATSSPLAARALALFTWLGLGIAHSIASTELFAATSSKVHLLAIVFPAEHRASLWSPNWSTYLPAVAALLTMGTLGFILGYRAFERSDA